MTGIPARAARTRAQGQIRYVTPVPYTAAPGPVARVYAQVERDFGLLAPPVALHAAVPELLAAAWTMLRETLVASGAADRTTKEAVATAVSLANTCPYCVEVHGVTLRGLAADDAAGLIAADRIGEIADPGLRAVAEWARRTGTPEGGAPPPGFPAGELIGVAVAFQYLNRMVNVFLPDSPLPANLPDPARGLARRLAARVMRSGARTPRAPGGSAGLLPPAPPPDDLAWAAGAPDVADAFARAAAAVGEAGRRWVPGPVREVVSAALDEWDGRPPGPSRAWTDPLVRDLPDSARPAARLALLTAMASYQVDASVVDAHRRAEPVRDGSRDAALIALTAWAAFAAARRTGARSARREKPAGT
ncbi:alkyl hydroperoxide reductase AhpD [Actinomadura cremea]|nr:alkyl hydroperoxide reductase AhpD [Actinomadura cremea]